MVLVSAPGLTSVLARTIAPHHGLFADLTCSGNTSRPTPRFPESFIHDEAPQRRAVSLSFFLVAVEGELAKVCQLRESDVEAMSAFVQTYRNFPPCHVASHGGGAGPQAICVGPRRQREPSKPRARAALGHAARERLPTPALPSCLGAVAAAPRPPLLVGGLGLPRRRRRRGGGRRG
jgi:hypothetical protein